VKMRKTYQSVIMFAIVEMQGFHLGTQFIPKEITFIKNGKSPVHYIIKTDICKDLLTTKERDIVKWNAKCYHGIAWEEGDITLDECVDSMKSLGMEKCLLFTKGREKAKFLEKMLGSPVSDMGVVCPSIRKIPYKNPCRAHNIVNARCSLISAQYLHDWMKNGHCDITKIPEKNEQEAQT
jgi:hypothetical protein